MGLWSLGGPLCALSGTEARGLELGPGGEELGMVKGQGSGAPGAAGLQDGVWVCVALQTDIPDPAWPRGVLKSLCRSPSCSEERS